MILQKLLVVLIFPLVYFLYKIDFIILSVINKTQNGGIVHGRFLILVQL